MTTFLKDSRGLGLIAVQRDCDSSTPIGFRFLGEGALAAKKSIDVQHLRPSFVRYDDSSLEVLAIVPNAIRVKALMAQRPSNGVAFERWQKMLVEGVKVME